MPNPIVIYSKQQWETLRGEDVTASVAGCLLGVHEYMTPYRLFAEKTGKLTDKVESSPALERGILLEPVAFALYKRERPVTHIQWNGTPGMIDGVYLRDPERRIGATVDAFAFDEDKGGRGVVQFKTVEAGIFRRKWHDEDGFVMPPLYIVVQAITEAKLADAKWAQVAAMVCSYGIEMHVIDIPLHEGVWDKLCTAVAEFWARIKAGDPPPPDFAEDGQTIARVYNERSGTMLDLTKDNRMPALLADRERLLASQKTIEAELDAVKNEIKFKVGNSAGAVAAGYTIKRHYINERTQTVKAHHKITISKIKVKTDE